eukprot:12481554-Alexandrium_andersonii.AAC.1
MRAAFRLADARLAHSEPPPQPPLSPPAYAWRYRLQFGRPPNQRRSSCSLLSRGSYDALASLAICDSTR